MANPTGEAGETGRREAWSREVQATHADYARYSQDAGYQALWSPFASTEENHRIQQYRAMAALFRGAGKASLAGWRILDVGCGNGRQLRSFIDFGAEPGKLVGLEILPERLDVARRLSRDLTFVLGSGCGLPFPEGSFDLVTQFVAFSSIGLHDLRQHLAREMVRVTASGGYIFWWDMMASVAPRDRGQTLDLDQLFPGLPRRSLVLGPKPLPSECLRPSRLRRFFRIRRLLCRILDRFACPPTHVAALIGPLHGQGKGSY
jgi:ubiquinone/menaquinone biosynthesis C-methylase UbiE